RNFLRPQVTARFGANSQSGPDDASQRSQNGNGRWTPARAAANENARRGTAAETRSCYSARIRAIDQGRPKRLRTKWRTTGGLFALTRLQRSTRKESSAHQMDGCRSPARARHNQCRSSNEKLGNPP